jgi:hypothetical protein
LPAFLAGFFFVATFAGAPFAEVFADVFTEVFTERFAGAFVAFARAVDFFPDAIGPHYTVARSCNANEHSRFPDNRPAPQISRFEILRESDA